MLRTLIIAALTSVFFAGCMEDGELTAEGATLAYEGNQSGDHQETAKCDEDGQITGSGNVEDGRLRVRVTDGSGEELWSKEFDSDVNFESESISGASGTWTISAERTGNDLAGDEFNGDYTFNLTC